MDDFPLPQEAEHIVHLGIVADVQQVVVSNSGLLFCCDRVRTTFYDWSVSIPYSGQLSEIPVNLNRHVMGAGDALPDADVVVY